MPSFSRRGFAAFLAGLGVAPAARAAPPREPAAAPGDIDLLDFVPPWERAGITAGTSTFDCAPALRRAIAAVGLRGAGPRILLPYGQIRLGSTIELKTAVTIEGRSGGGMAGGHGSTVQVAPDACGFIVERYNTAGEGLQSPPTTGGDNSLLRNFKLAGGGGRNPAAHGIWMRARTILEDLEIGGFSGNGINILATAVGGGPGLEGNANNWQVSRCRIVGCGGHGLHARGADVNAGVAIAVDASGNGGWGVYDGSFLGNTYIGCHAAANRQGAYKTDNHNARNVFLGCYSESGQPASSMVYPSLVLGGLHGAGFTAASTMTSLQSAFGTALINRGIQDSGDDGAGSAVTSKLGGEAANGTVLYTAHSRFSPQPWRLRWDEGDLRWDHADLDADVPWRITGDRTRQTFGRRAAQVGQLNMPGPFIGPGNHARQLTYGAAAPAAGEHAAGDIVFNIAPAPGGHAGWICVAAGAPGSWKPFGAIEA